MKKNRINMGYKLINSEIHSKENDYAFFYKKMYNAIETLEYLYQNGYKDDKFRYRIMKENKEPDMIEEYMNLKSLFPAICSVLIGLNREDLQTANSNTENRNLFQYKDYISDAPVINDERTSIQMIKDTMKKIKFNESLKGPFPYMVEIVTNDTHERPYDIVSKIRNALEHAEYYQPKGNNFILKIQNHDDNKLIFEGKILELVFTQFVEEYYGFGQGVASEFNNYNFVAPQVFTNEKDLKEFLQSITNEKFIFTKIPEHLTFNGTKALYDKINENYKPGGIEKKKFKSVLKELENDGVECKIENIKLSDEQITGFINYLKEEYKTKLYNNPFILKDIMGIIKLFFSPRQEIANCYNNIFRYIRLRNNYIYNYSLPDETILKEMREADENLNLSFKTSLLFLKINIINYLIENKAFEYPDLSKLDISDFILEPIDKLGDKIVEAMKHGVDSKYAKEYVVLNTIRNALAHGGKKIEIIIDKEIKIKFNDIYNGNNFSVTTTLQNLEKLYSNSIFKPENLILKKEESVKKLAK